MAKIVDPDNLNQGVEIVFNTGSKLIELNPIGNLTAQDGVSLQSLYSFTKEEWRTDDNLIRFQFPFVSITAEQFELVNGWDISGSITDVSSSKNMIRDAGWALKDSAGGSNEEFMNVTSLGAFDSSINDQAYYLQVAAGTPDNTVFNGEVNQAVLIYASASADFGDFDYRAFFTLYLREQAKTYGIYDLISEQNLAAITYKKFALPLTNGTDLKVTRPDTDFTGSPYTGMDINYYTESQLRNIGGLDYPFKVIVDGNSGTAEEIYEWVQFQLRQTSDIDSNDNLSSVRGDTAAELMAFVGDSLQTKTVTVDSLLGGVYIDNFLAADTNRLQFNDDSGSARTFPFVAAGTMLFNPNLQNDTSARYFIFFTNDDAGDNTGRDFGTQDAIIVEDNSSNLITGSVATSGSVSFDYDYDNNVQRGGASAGADVPFTGVALGLDTAQYVVTTGTIVRSTSNSINFVAALERNYLNP